jgi:hypothetical protein
MSLSIARTHQCPDGARAGGAVGSARCGTTASDMQGDLGFRPGG